MSGRGAHTKNIPLYPIVVYHPYTWKHYSQYNNKSRSIDILNVIVTKITKKVNIEVKRWYLWICLKLRTNIWLRDAATFIRVHEIFHGENFNNLLVSVTQWETGRGQSSGETTSRDWETGDTRVWVPAGSSFQQTGELVNQRLVLMYVKERGILRTAK